jgi:hypothetical protein
MRGSRLAVSAAVAVAAVLALLLAQDLRSWRHTLASDTVDFSLAPRRPLPLTAPTILPAGLSSRLLDIRRDREWLDALQKFVVTYDQIENQDALGPGAYRLLHISEAALAKVTQDPGPARASQAYNLLGVLVFRSAYPGTGVDPGLVQDALSDIQNAIRVDGSNEAAKENLELALRTLVASHTVSLKSQGTGNHTTKIRKGGYGGPPGQGY